MANSDTITLGDGTSSGFSLSEGDTVLTVSLDQTATTAEELHIVSGDGADIVNVESLPATLRTLINAGDDADFVSAASSDVDVEVLGGPGLTVQSHSDQVFIRTGENDDTFVIDALSATDVSEVGVQTASGEDNIDGSDADTRVIGNGGSGADRILGGSPDDELRGAAVAVS